MEHQTDYDFHEFRGKKKEDPEREGGRRTGAGSLFLAQLIICLITAILLLFANVLFPEPIKELRRFYEMQVRDDAGITQDVSNLFHNVAEFLTAPAGDDSSSPSSGTSVGSSDSDPFSADAGASDDSSGISSTSKPDDSDPSSAPTTAMGMGGEENPLPLSHESAGLGEIDTEPLKTDYVLPISGKISSGHGYRIHPITGLPDFHKGIDVPAEEGTEIAAFRSGTVIQAQSSVSFGNFVAIRHEDGVITRYGHCSKLNVEVGDAVEAGDIVGYVGNTGYSTGNHCHFDISVNGVFIDPLKVIPGHLEDGYAAI